MLFVPRQQYVVTPVLINLNILIFIVVTLSGVHVLSPAWQDMIAVGANFGPYTLTGEWWRLFSSMFLHIGVLHLLVNMYALVSIGGVLESLVGKKQFALAYVLCGLAGSLGSLWWDQMRISAGASGAIFGMFGMFMTVVLLERKMSWQEKKGMVLNMLGVIAFNLVFGLQSGIDNAAHTGGLVMGIVFGAVLLLRSGRYITQRYSSLGNALTVAVVLVAFTALYVQIPATHAKYLSTMLRFEEKEQEALVVLEDMLAAGYGEGADRYTDELEQGIAIWHAGIAELAALGELPDLKAQEAKEVETMLHYARLRKKSYEMMRDDLQAKQPWMNPKQQEVMQAISTSVEEMNQLRGNKNGQ
ncbi:peptidase S54 [Pontibacter sp. HJ8]